MVNAPFLAFHDWKQLYVHVNESWISLGAILSHLGEGEMDHPVIFPVGSYNKWSGDYTTIEREGLAIIYVLQKFHRYLLGGYFKFFTDHYDLKYLVNKPMMEG